MSAPFLFLGYGMTLMRRWLGWLVARWGLLDGSDVMFALGLVLGAVGFGAVYWPLGFIYAGLILTALGIVGALK